MNPLYANYASETRDAVTLILEGYEKLQALDQQRSALDLGSSLSQDDLQGENAHLTPANINAVTTTLTALETLMNQGHGTNLYRVKK